MQEMGKIDYGSGTTFWNTLYFLLGIILPSRLPSRTHLALLRPAICVLSGIHRKCEKIYSYLISTDTHAIYFPRVLS